MLQCRLQVLKRMVPLEPVEVHAKRFQIRHVAQAVEQALSLFLQRHVKVLIWLQLKILQMLELSDSHNNIAGALGLEHRLGLEYFQVGQLWHLREHINLLGRRIPNPRAINLCE